MAMGLFGESPGGNRESQQEWLEAARSTLDRLAVETAKPLVRDLFSHMTVVAKAEAKTFTKTLMDGVNKSGSKAKAKAVARTLEQDIAGYLARSLLTLVIAGLTEVKREVEEG
jgi:hypothetical protein